MSGGAWRPPPVSALLPECTLAEHSQRVLLSESWSAGGALPLGCHAVYGRRTSKTPRRDNGSQMAQPKEEVGRKAQIQPLFTRAPHQRLPVARPCPLWKFPSAAPPRQRRVSARGGLAGRPPPATRSAHRAAGACAHRQTGSHVWDGGHGTAATLCHTRRRGERLPRRRPPPLRLGLPQ